MTGKHGGMGGSGGMRHITPGAGRRSEGVRPTGAKSGEAGRSHEAGAMHSSGTPKDRHAHQANIGTHSAHRAPGGKG